MSRHQEIHHVFEAIKQLMDSRDSRDAKRRYGFPSADTAVALLAQARPE
jgi:cytidylate kinase